MSITLSICNPSDYRRKGHVSVPLQRVNEIARRQGEAEIATPRVVLLANSKTRLPAQIDELIRGDWSSAVLSFAVEEWLEPGGNPHYRVPGLTVSVEPEPPARPSGAAQGGGPSTDPRLSLEVVQVGGKAHGVKLRNSRLELWFNLVPTLHEQEQRWYAGAATTVLLEEREMLDPNPAWEAHASEKRCMQVDYIRLPLLDVPMFNQPYEIFGSSTGPVRASFTAASQPFDYRYRGPLSGKEHHLKCRLFRVISLYANAEHVTEELFVRGLPEGGDGGGAEFPTFIASYFAYVNAMKLHCSAFPHIPDWFAVSSLARPYLSYGFATDMHAGAVSLPHPQYPHWAEEEHSFSWPLYPAVRAKCVHLFSRYQPTEREIETDGTIDVYAWSAYEAEKAAEARRHFEDRIGQAWYEEVFKPLGLQLP